MLIISLSFGDPVSIRDWEQFYGCAVLIYRSIAYRSIEASRKINFIVISEMTGNAPKVIHVVLPAVNNSYERGAACTGREAKTSIRSTWR